MQPSGYRQGGLDATFAALADPTSRAILETYRQTVAAPETFVRRS